MAPYRDFPLWFAVVTIAKQLTGGGYAGGQAWARTYWRTLLAGSPAWMRTMTYGFFAYALVNFAIFFLFTASGHGAPKSAGDPPAFVWHGFSGHWMAFYSAGLAIATSAYLRGPGNLTPRCPNGHAVSLMDRYCPQCGQPISGNDAT